MMIKTVDIQFTGQPIVRLLDNSSLTKTAENDIQQYWNSLQKSPKYSYLHVLAMTDSNHYGPNNNGDWFNEEDLKKYHNTFCSDAYIYLHHVNKDPAKSVGRPIFSFYNDNMHRVELILAIEKNNPLAIDTVAKIKRGEQLYVSMGCKVPYDICSICKHEAKTRQLYCDHLKFEMKRVYDDGRQVYAINPPPLKFFDISIVTRPADRVAWALDKIACESVPTIEAAVQNNTISKEALDVIEQDINKFSEILKTVDGEVLDYKDLDHEAVSKLQFISKMPTVDMDIPEYTGSAPVGTLIRISISKGIPPTFGELGRSLLGDSYNDHSMTQIIQGLRGATELLRRNPAYVLDHLRDIFSTDDHKDHRDIEFVMTKRAEMFKKANLPIYQGTPHGLLPPNWAAHVPMLYRTMTGMTKYGPGMLTPITAHDEAGNVFHTNRYNATIAADTSALSSIPKTLGKVILSMTAVGILMAGLSPVNIAAATAFALGAASLTQNNNVQVDIPLRGEVPHNTYFSKAAALNKGNVITAAMPTMLGLDYYVNSKVRHSDNPYYREGMGEVGKAVDTAGEFAYNHPITSISGALVGKGLLSGVLKRLKKVR